MATQRIKDLPSATLAATDRIPLESIADDVTRKTTPSALFNLLIGSSTWAASASQAGILTSSGNQGIGGDKQPTGNWTFTGSVAITGTASAQNPTSWLGKDSGNCLFVDNSFGTALSSSANVTIIIDSSNASTTRTFTVRHNSKNVGAASVFSVDESGLVDASGTIRVTGSGAPGSGVGGELSWNGTRTILLSFNRGTTAYQPVALDGSQVELRPSGTSQVTVTTASSLFANPIIYASYTLATKPTASSFTRAVIWISDMTGGAQLAYSDGVDWRRVSDNTIAS